MKLRFLYLGFVFLLVSFIPAGNFRTQQLKHSKVSTAYKEKWKKLKESIHSKGFDTLSMKVFIRGFKEERDLEVWIRDKNHGSFSLFKSYPFCELSGELGPKRQQGDMQVPEGFYHINIFNPYSNYYLSLGVSYPNSSDAKLGKKPLGGQIMIHGKCVTIGCIPITDEYIKELYVLCVEAKNNGQENIPVHLFPFRMTIENLQQHSASPHLNFWKNLQSGYNYFEKEKKLPKVSVDTKGSYLFG